MDLPPPNPAPEIYPRPERAPKALMSLIFGAAAVGMELSIVAVFAVMVNVTACNMAFAIVFLLLALGAGVFSILAVVFGFQARRWIKALPYNFNGGWMAVTGIVLGFVGLGIMLLMLALVALAVVALISFFSSGGFT